MPETARNRFRQFLPSANQALVELEEATGKPVMVVEAPELNVLATIRRAGPEDASHVLRIQGGSNRTADYLIVFECRMALRDRPGPRVVVRGKPEQREQVIRDCESLQRQMGPEKTRELGTFLYDGLIQQLRSIGPGLLVDRWIRSHCPDLQAPQAQVIESQITGNQEALKPSTRAIFPAAIYEASIAMNAAYAVLEASARSPCFLSSMNENSQSSHGNHRLYCFCEELIVISRQLLSANPVCACSYG
jgi:hypothetical protein